MSHVSLKEARRRLGDLVSAAERGETVIITRRGRTVARLVPSGRKKAARGLPDLAAFRASQKVRGRSLTEEVLAQRREARH